VFQNTTIQTLGFLQLIDVKRASNVEERGVHKIWKKSLNMLGLYLLGQNCLHLTHVHFNHM